MRLTAVGFNVADGLASAIVDVGPDNEIVGIEFPAAWTNAGITFQACEDGVTASLKNVHDSSGNELTITGAADANRVAGLLDSVYQALRHFRYVRLRSGTAGAAVQQGASRTVGIWVRAKR